MNYRVLWKHATAWAFLWLLLAGMSAAQQSVSPKLATNNLSSHSPTSKMPDRGAGLLGDHYLMLVNTAVAFNMTEDKFRQFDQSGYDGLAVAFHHAYDTSSPLSAKSISDQLSGWKKFTSKDIWPWVYANRIVGKSPVEENSHAENFYFKNISGVDLDDHAGALSDFLQIWKNALAAANDAKVPGIVCDLEFYNYYKEYDIGELARQTGKTPAAAALALRKIGARMADLAATAYPQASLWFLFTGLTHPGYKTFEGVPYYPSPTYIALGLLDEILVKHLALKVITGGEGSIGYCHASVGEFQSSIEDRQVKLANELQRYDGVLELGGTLALWSDRATKKDWLTEGMCKASQASNIEELQPYIELLLKTYRYNWLYGTSEGNYLPFIAVSARRFDAVINRAKLQVAGKLSNAN
jgi:hypothetical protein